MCLCEALFSQEQLICEKNGLYKFQQVTQRMGMPTPPFIPLLSPHYPPKKSPLTLS